jgi:hypothetical protein
MLSKEPNALSRQVQIRLLKELFERAPTAQNQTPVSNATLRYDTLSYQKALDSSSLPFNTLDIQARTVSLLRSKSPPLSWELLQEISLPTRRTDCMDSLTPNPTPYYQVMVSSLNAIRSTVVPDGRTKVAYLLQQINEMKTPSQLQAFATSVVTLDIRPSQKIPLFDAIIIRIGAINGSDREMFGADNPANLSVLTPAIAGLVESEKSDDISPVPLLRAYRAFLVRNLHATACADSTLDRVAEATSFNALDSSLIGEDPKPVRALSSQELTPTSLAGVANDETIGLDGGIREPLRRIHQIFKANQKAFYQSDSGEEVAQPNPSDVQDALKHALDLGTNDSSSNAARFENQMAILGLLMRAIPPGPSLNDVIDADIALLNLNPSEQQSPLSWLRHFQELMFTSRPITVDVVAELQKRSKSGELMIMLPSPDALFIRQTLRRYQSDPVISAYLAYEDIFHPVYISEDTLAQRPPL